MGSFEETVKLLQKKFGKSYINVASEVLDTDYQRNSMGLFALDFICGGGLPERKIMMLAGQESAGKTSTMLSMIAYYQKMGKKCALLNKEFGFDAVWANKLGVQLDKLWMARPQTIEEASDTIEPLIIAGEFDLIALDSIAGLSSDKELEESAEVGGRSGNAKANGAMVRKITSRLNDCAVKIKTSILLINQIREKQNIRFGSPTYTPGGHALHHACDIIIWLRQNTASKAIGGKENPLGIGVNAYCSKNRTAPPFRTSIYNVMFDGHLDERENLIELGIVNGVIEKMGYKYTFGDKSITDLKPFMKALTDEDYQNIKKQILEKKEALNITIKESDNKVLDSNLEGTV